MATIERLQQGIAKAKAENRPDLVEKFTRELTRMQGEAKPAEGLMGQWSEEIKDDPSLGTAAYQGISNIPGSAWQAAKDMVQPIMHPIDTAQGLDTLLQGAAGHANLALAENLPDWLKTGIGFRQLHTREAPSPEMEIAKKAGKILAHRGIHWRETLRDDPVGLLSDVAGMVMPAGAAVRGAGTLSRIERLANAGQRISRFGEAIQPSNIVARPIPAVVRRLPIVGEEASLARMRRLAPTPQRVAQETAGGYQDLAQRRIEIPPPAYNEMMGNINTEVARPNLYPETRTPEARGVIQAIHQGRAVHEAPLQGALQRAQNQLERARETARASAAMGSPAAAADTARVTRLERLEAGRRAQVQRGPPLPFEDAENARRSLLDIAPPATRTDRALANAARRSIDEAIDTLPEQPRIHAAREMGRRNWLADTVQEIMHSPERVSGYESSMRNQVQSFLKRQGQSLTPTELNAFNRIVRREGMQNVMHTLASRIGLLANVAGGIAGTRNPLVGGAAAVGANIAARHAAETLTDRQMREALQTVLAGTERQRVHQRRTDWRRAGYQTLGRGGAVAGTYLRPYGAMTRPVDVTSPEQEEFWYGKRK